MKKMLFVVLVLALLTLTACGGGGKADTAIVPASIPAEFAGKTNPLGADSAMAGAEIFKNNCVACHGEQGRGDGPAGAALIPAPTNLAKLASMVGDDYFFGEFPLGKLGHPWWVGKEF